MIEPIPQPDDEIGARARSARVDNTMYFADIPGIFNKHSALISLLKQPGEIFGLGPAITGPGLIRSGSR